MLSAPLKVYVSTSENTSVKIHSKKPIHFVARHNLTPVSSSTYTALEINTH